MTRTREMMTADALQRMALNQASWSARERRRRQELAYFLQRRLAWELALGTSSDQRSKSGGV